jgi:hypothetical protein
MAAVWRRFIQVFPFVLMWLVVPMSVQAQRDTSRIATIGGVHLGIPLIASASVAVVLARRERQWGQAEGPFVGAELGALGLSAHVGHVRPFDGGATIVRVGALQWWGRGQNTYVGGNVRFMLMAGMGIGAYARVAGTRGPTVLPMITIGFEY